MIDYMFVLLIGTLLALTLILLWMIAKFIIQCISAFMRKGCFEIERDE